LPQQAGVRVSPYAGLAKMLQSYTAGKMQDKALQQQAALAEKYQAGNQADVGAFMQAIQGTPAKELAGPAPQGAPQGISPEGEQGGYIQPAQAPDRQRAMALALGSQNPTLQGAGGAMLTQMLTPPESAFAKLNPKDYTPDSVKLFMATGGKDFSVLKPLEKLHFADTGAGIQALNPYTAEPVSTALAKELSPSDKQQKEISDRAFNQLSANQRASLANEAARIGISAQQLFFDTGMRAGGGYASAPPAPLAQPNAPVVAPRVPTTPVAGAPVANAPPTNTSPYTPFSNLNAQANDLVLPPKLRLEQMKNAPTQENTLRDEFNTLTKDFRTVQDAHSKIKSVANTGAGDMSLLYSYVKLLDPGSVVRESEFATAAASGSFGERIQGLAQRVMSGQRLPPDLRTDFIREADSIYTSQKDGADRLEKQYRDIAKRNNLNPENVIVNYASSSGTALPPVNTLKEGQVTTFDNGQQWTLKNGKQVQVK